MRACITVNSGAKIRRATYNGREYLVAPITMIVPGVLAGSHGPLYYPPGEMKKKPAIWNGKPIVVGHPYKNGQPVTAKASGVLEKQGIGFLRNATYKNKLKAEGWFDAERTKELSPRIYDSLIHNKPIESSTGLFTDNDPVPLGAVDNKGRPYGFIARNHRADHLAVLTDERGACSIEDGCGVLVNSAKTCSCGGECLKCRVHNAWHQQPRHPASGTWQEMPKNVVKRGKLAGPKGQSRSFEDLLKALESVKVAETVQHSKGTEGHYGVNREFSAGEREELALTGAAMPSGGYPIKSKQDLKNAIQAFGRAKNKSATKAHIIKRAKALGAAGSLPESWTTNATSTSSVCKLCRGTGKIRGGNVTCPECKGKKKQTLNAAVVVGKIEGWTPLTANCDMSYDEIQDLVRSEFCKQKQDLASSDYPKSPFEHPYVVAVFESYLIYTCHGETYRQQYKLDTDERCVTFTGTPEAVIKQVDYVPA